MFYGTFAAVEQGNSNGRAIVCCNVSALFQALITILKPRLKQTLLLLLAPRCLIMYLSSSEDILGCNSGLLDTINDHKMNQRTPILPEMRKQGPRYNVLLEGAIGKPSERRELKSFRGSWGIPLQKFETKPFRLG